MNLRWFLFIFICVSVVVLVIADLVFNLRSEQIAAIIPMLAVLGLIGPGLLGRYAGENTSKILPHIALWMGIITVIMLVAYLFPDVIPQH